MLEFKARTLLPNDLLALKYVHDGRLSPDGRAVAYVTSRTIEEPPEELFEIAIKDLVTGAHRELAFDGRATFPRWSPDGARLAFIGTKGGSTRIYIADANKYDVTALTPEGSEVQGPVSWSPDSSSIAYTVITHRKSEGLRRIRGSPLSRRPPPYQLP